MKTGRILALMLSLALFMTLAAACGDDEPAPAAPAGGVSASELQSAITAAIEAAASSAPSGVTADQMTAAVNAAVSAAAAGIVAPEGVSATEIAKLVEDAVKAQVQPGASAAEIAALVEGAVQAAESARAPGVTLAQLTKAVEDAVVAIEPVVVEKQVIVQVTPLPASTQPTGLQPTGTLTVGISVLPPLVQLPSKDAAGTVGSFGMDWSVYEGIVKAGLPPIPGSPSSPDPGDYLPEIAESWLMSSDQRKLTFNIRKGIQFHGDLGEVTAEDVAWTFNESFKEGSTGNGPEQLPPSVKVGWDVLDRYIAVMNIAEGGAPPTWGVLLGKGWSDTYGILSKRHYDRVGEADFITTPIGTGPFEVQKWVGHDEMIAETVEDHWRVTPSFARLHIVSMPEQATREAALLTGEVDIAPIPGKALNAIVDEIGGGAIGVSMSNPNTIYMSGNYWGATCATCPETDVYRKWAGFTEAIEKGYPWVGDPDDAVQMEKARKVRLAMSMAIDRQTIIDTVLGGFGDPVYIHMHHQFPPGSPNYKDEWTIPYDPVAAKDLMTEAGYANGFDFTFWATADFSFWDPEIADAVAEMWRQNLDLDVTVEHTPYASRRPSSVDKSMNIPWLHGWGLVPGDTKAGFFCPGPGHIGGLTLPDDICEIGFRNDVEPDFATRIANNAAMTDYLSEWALHIGIATVGNYFVYQPYVKGWRPYTVNYFNNPESISIEK